MAFIKREKEIVVAKASKLKIAHWVMFNSSGMFRVAESLARTECQLGIDSWLADCANVNDYAAMADADVHVVHTHFPDAVRPMLKKPLRLVWVAHGTPEYVFQRSVEAGQNRGYGADDSFQLSQYWMQHADAIVTFWERHQAIIKSLCDKNTVVDYMPMGLDKDFWKPVESRGKYLGSPSLFTAENADYSKWILDLVTAWGWVWQEVPTAFLHAVYIPTDQHRWFYPLMNRNGSAFKTISAGIILNQVDLRNAFCSTDYYIGLVKYGDCNRICAEANASGAKTISYEGNEYTDFWVREGDQRRIASDLLAILKGEVEPRKKKEIADVRDTAQAMIKIYERIV